MTNYIQKSDEPCVTGSKKLNVLQKITLKSFYHHVHIFRLVQNGKSWKVTRFFETPSLQLEIALRQYDDFLTLILFQHQTVVSAVNCFGEDTAKPCVLTGSTFEGCFLPRNLNSGQGNAVEFDFFVSLPTPIAEESEGPLQYIPLDDKPNQVLLKLSNVSIINWQYLGIKSLLSDLQDSFLKQCKDGLYLKRNFLVAMEEKIQNSLLKVVVEKPGGMEMVSRFDLGCGTGLQASFKVSFSKSITERLEMLPLDPDTWSGDTMTNAQMLWVNLTNWSSSFWPARIFDIHPVLECQWPANALMNWCQRQRQWPSERTVQMVAQSSCYLHPLWCQEKGLLRVNDDVMAFEMTFPVAERLLFSETELKERQCMVVLKAMKDKYFQDSKILSSFVIKVVFFWHLESMPLSERQDIGRGELLICLLEKLICFLNDNNLPHFFVPSVNLLESFDGNDANTTLIRLQKVKRNLFDYLSSELFQVKCSKSVSDDFLQKVLQFI